MSRMSRDNSLMEEERVSLVERVNFSSTGNGDLRVSEDKLSDSLHSILNISVSFSPIKGKRNTHVIKGVTINSSSETQDQVGGWTIHCVTGYDHLTTRSKHICKCSSWAFSLFFENAHQKRWETNELEEMRRKTYNFVDSENRSNVDSGIDVWTDWELLSLDT